MSVDAEPSAPTHHALLDDESLVLSVDPAARSAVEHWIPAMTSRVPSAAQGCIRVHAGAGRTLAVPACEATLEFMGLRCWFDHRTGRSVILTEDGTLEGVIDLQQDAADLWVAPGEHEALLRIRAECALNIAAGLLLGRRERVLLHAAAFVSPDGRAWLLAGDTFSGKSSTCATLVRAGWDYLADDQVVLGRHADAQHLELVGWARHFNLDDGFAEGTSLKRRSPVDPASLGPGRRQRSARLGGVLFPVIEANAATRLEPLSAGDVLGRLIRHAPWLLADASSARRVLDFLSTVASYPAYRLRLGSDAYATPESLIAALVPALGPDR
jgi:hypothetical protein